MRELRLTQAHACAKPFMVLACSLLFTLFTSLATYAQCDPSSGSIAGIAYMDTELDGTFGTGEVGASNIMVTAYDNDGVSLGFALTASDGTYTIENMQDGDKVMLQFSYANTLSPGILGPDNGSTIQYVTVPSCNNNIGLVNPQNSCSTNPELILTCFSQGAFDGENRNLETILGIEHNFTNNSQPVVYARAEQTGSVWGVAWKNTTKDIFSSAFVKQYSGLKDGPGAIYRTRNNGTNYETHLFADLRNLGVNVAPLASIDVFDCDYGAQAGKYGLGSLVLSPDEEWLYTINLSDNTLVKISSTNPTIETTTVTTIPDPGCGNGDSRAFALVFRGEDLYVGTTCTAETSYLNGGLPSELEQESAANVFKYTPKTDQWDLEFTTNYIKGYWRDDFESSYKTIHWLTDLDFTDEGNMLLSLSDRVGHRFCSATGRIDGQNPDLLVVYKDATGEWKLESNGQIEIATNSGNVAITGTGVNNGEGPDGGEFFAYDHWLTDPSYHAETALGSIVVLPGSGSVVAMVYDPLTDSYSGGIHRYSTGDGSKLGAKQLYTRDFTANLGKATGFGNLVVKCGGSPIEIGNYVWNDTNNDGKQNAGESGFSGLPLELLNENCIVIGTTTTDANGYYVFNMTNIDRNQDGVFDGLMPNTKYYVKVGESIDESGMYYEIGGIRYFTCSASTSSTSNKTDCDINIIENQCENEPLVAVLTNDFGYNDHNFDIGLYAPQDFDLALKKEILSSGVITYGSIVNYKITIENQGDIAANNIRIVDYLSDAYDFDETINPGWQLTDGKLYYLYNNEIDIEASADIYLRLKIKEYKNGNELLNFAEIASANNVNGTADRDIDSFFDEIEDNDPGAMFNTDTDNEMNDNGIIDEDDHDVAGLNIFDLALMIEHKVPGEFYKQGDKVDFIISVFNQGLVDAESFGIVNYVTEGLKYINDVNDGWELVDNKLSFTESEGIVAGTKKEYCVSFIVEEIGSADDILQYAEISHAKAAGGFPSIDYDSTPDDNPGNDKGGEMYTPQNNLITDSGVFDEDDHDPVVVRMRNIDLALRKTAVTNAAIEGEPALFKIEIINQGSETIGGFEVVDFFPSELILNDANWNATGNKAFRSVSIPEGLKYGESYPLFINFELATGTNQEPIVNYAEIYKVYSMDDEDISLFDIDSTPDGINDNDNGGIVNSAFDDFIQGTKLNDEDDHDPAQLVFISSEVTNNCDCTDPTAGYFTNEIKITAEDGQKWFVDQALGAYSTTSTPEDLVVLETGITGDTLVVEVVTGVEDDYVLSIYSLDGHPWQLTLRNEQDNEVLLQGSACNTDYIIVSGETAICTGSTEVYTVINKTSGDVYTFDIPDEATLVSESANSVEIQWNIGGGPYELEVSNGGTNADCQRPTIIGGQGVTVGVANGAMSCIGHTNVSLNGQCELLVRPNTISSTPLDPMIPYSVMLVLPDGSIVPDNILTHEHVGMIVEAKLFEGCGNNQCWGTITVEDKLGPVFNCVDTEVFCFNLEEYSGPLAVDACEGPVESVFTLEETELLPKSEDFVKKLTRTYIAQDSKGNEANEPCVVDIFVKRIKFIDIDWPEDIKGNDALICTDLDEFGIPSLEVSGIPSVFGYPLLPTIDGLCDFTLTYEDMEATHFGCITSVMREFTAVFWDVENETYTTDSYTQVIEVDDNNNPTFDIPLADISVEAGGIQCMETVSIPYPTGVNDQCNDIKKIYLQWSPSAPNTLPGFEADVDFPFDIELPLGESQVTYIAFDECNNSSSSSIVVTVTQAAGPTAICKELTVALGADGFAYLPALQMGSESSAVCGSIVSYQVRRIDDGADCYIDPATGENDPTTEFGDRVIFCCKDAGTTLMIELLVEDSQGNTSGCMGMVTIQDPHPPVVSDLVDVEIDCGIYSAEELANLNDSDPDNDIDLSQFGFPAITDECGADTTVITSFTKLMPNCTSIGTITRQFIANDTNGADTSSQSITITKDPFEDSDIAQFEDLDTNVCMLELLIPELLPAPYNEPQLTEGVCDSITFHHTDDEYTFPLNNGTVNDHCYKIIRNWEITSWCDLDLNGNPITFQRTQIIKIVNLDPPTIANAPLEDIIQCYEMDSVTAFVDVVVTANDDCTIPNNLEWAYTLYDNTEDTVMVDMPYGHHYGNVIDVSDVYPIGSYRLEFAFRDRCGNEVIGVQLFAVEEECNNVDECVGPLPDVDINNIECLVDINNINILVSGMPSIDTDCTDCIVANTEVLDDEINGVGVTCDTIRRTLILTFNCPDGAEVFVERSHDLIIHNTNDPIITAPAAPASMMAVADCEAYVDIEEATATFECNTVTISNDSDYADDDGADASGTYPVGNWIVRYTAIDLCGNMTTDSIAVSVTDGEGPNCSADQNYQIVLYDTDAVSVTGDQLNDNSMDDCSSGMLTFSIESNSFDCSDAGTTTSLTLTVMDSSGNSSSCDGLVEVIDSIPPICMGGSLEVVLDANGEATVDPADLDMGSTDLCGDDADLIFELSQTEFTCADEGSALTLVLTVTDLNGNSSQCDATVTVVDNTAPICDAQDITISFTDTGSQTITGAMVNGNSTDVCSGVLTYSVSPDTFDCTNVGDNIVTLTVTDESNNTSTCTATVVVEDLVAPICVTKDVTISLMDDGTISINSSVVDDGSVDGCDGIDLQSLTVTPFAFDCDNIGENVVVLTAIDSNGNSSMCDAIVTIEDTTGPECMVQDITVSLTTEAGVTVAAEDFDNGSSDLCGGPLEFEVDQTLFDCDDLGDVNEVVITITDQYNNESTCTANVTVEDDIEIQCIAQDITVNLDDTGNISITPDQIDNVSSAGCNQPITLDLDIQNFSCNDVQLSPITVTLTVTVVATGETSECTATVTVMDTELPTIECMDDVTVDCDDFTGNLESYGNVDNIIFDDNCLIGVTIVEEEVVTDINTCGIGTYTRTFVVTDQAGNSSSCNQVVTVVIGDNPLIEEDITFPSADTLFFEDCSSFDPTNLDTTVEIDSLAAECFDVYIDIIETGINPDMPCNDTITRTFMVFDSCQVNTAGFLVGSYEQTIIINDTTAPIAFGPADLTVMIEDTMTCTVDLDLIGFGTDECDPDQINLNTTITDEDGIETEIIGGDASGAYEVGVYSIAVTASDDCNNSNTYNYSVTVLDTVIVDVTCLKIQPLMEADLSVDVLAEMIADTIEYFSCDGVIPMDTVISFSATDIMDTVKAYGCEAVLQPVPAPIYLWFDGILVDSCRGSVQLMDPTDLCMNGLVGGAVVGTVFTADNVPVPAVHVDLDGSGEFLMTDDQGHYAFPEMFGGESYEVIPTKDDGPMDGVTTLDLILIQRHILGLTDLDSPYDLIAADIDANGSISGIDVVQLRKMILGIYDEFPSNTSWRMVDREFEFWDPTNAQEEAFPETYDIDALLSKMKVDFIGVKTGDVNGSVVPGITSSQEVSTRADKTWYLKVTDRKVREGEVITIPISISDATDLQGFQMAIATDKVSDINLASSVLDITEDNYSIDRFGVVNISWNTLENLQLTAGTKVLELTIIPTADAHLSDMVIISDDIVMSQTYANNDIAYTRTEILWDISKSDFALFQNAPNPWAQTTDISFMIPAEGDVIINVRSVNGQLVKTFEGYYESGIHSVELTKDDLLDSGAYYYEMRYDNRVVLEKMILLR